MSNFKNLYATYISQLDRNVITEAEDPDAQLAGNDQAQNTQDVQPQVPSPEEVKEPTQDVTSEGKKFLVELTLKALGVDPDNIPASDKSIFNTEVTVDNAEDVLKRVQNIVDLYR